LKLAKSDEVTTRKKSIKIIAQLVLNGTMSSSAASYCPPWLMPLAPLFR
jgi:hypothetical protein